MQERGTERNRDAALPAEPVHDADDHRPESNALVDCGWGRLMFGQTFERDALLASLREERPGHRDIAFDVTDPHLVLAAAPELLFLDPSHCYRLQLAEYEEAQKDAPPCNFRPLSGPEDVKAVNAIYQSRGLVELPETFHRQCNGDDPVMVLVAEDRTTGAILGAVMGVDHVRAFRDPEGGSSLWSLAVAPDAPHGHIGEFLVRGVAERFKSRGRGSVDLTVMHDNAEAISLYTKLGFSRVRVFSVKCKNQINERLYAARVPGDDLNPYARIVIDEASRRGIHTEVLDAEGGYFNLSFGGRTVRCRESLSDLTSAVAMSLCDDKRVTRRLVAAAGIEVPEQVSASDQSACKALLEQFGKVVVKPARGEQGRGISVGLTTADEIEAAISKAREISTDVVVERHFEGEDLRLIVINYKVVAAAVRRPPQVVGDGRSTIRRLIEAQSRRKSAATSGESTIPIDGETESCLAEAGYSLDQVLERDVELTVRKAANLHTGGTIHDVTAETHPTLLEAAVRAAWTIGIPVTGIDLLVKSAQQPDYVFIEANERPGLAHHEPQPTAERFLDLLFPLTVEPAPSNPSS